MCFGVNVAILTQNCLNSRHYQEFFLKHTAGLFLNVDYQHISQLGKCIYSVFN